MSYILYINELTSSELSEITSRSIRDHFNLTFDLLTTVSELVACCQKNNAYYTLDYLAHLKLIDRQATLAGYLREEVLDKALSNDINTAFIRQMSLDVDNNVINITPYLYFNQIDNPVLVNHFINILNEEEDRIQVKAFVTELTGKENELLEDVVLFKLCSQRIFLSQIVYLLLKNGLVKSLNYLSINGVVEYHSLLPSQDQDAESYFTCFLRNLRMRDIRIIKENFLYVINTN